MTFLKRLWNNAANNASENPANGNASAEGVAQLFAAVQNNDTLAVKALLDSGVPVDSRNELGETPLMLAVHRHQVSMIHELLAREADPNAQAADDLTPLCYATQIGHWDMVELLAQNGAKISSKNAKEFLLLNASLLRATEERDNEQISALQAAGVTDAETLRSKVFQIVARDDARALEHLLNSGVPATLRDVRGNTLLDKATEASAGNSIALLAEFGATTVTKTSTPVVPTSPEELQKALTTAIDDKKYGLVATLVKAGAQPSMVGDDKLFELGAALIRSRDIAAVTLFLNSETVNDQNVGAGASRAFSLLHLAAEGDAAIAKLVVEKFPTLINRKEACSLSPLRVAMINQNAAMTEVLLAAGANPNTTGKQKGEPLKTDIEFAHGNCNEQIVGAVTAAQEKFALIDAAANGDADAANKAMSAGVPVDLVDGSGNTILFYAAQRGFTDVAQVLLRHGAKATRPGANGSTPMSVAVSGGHADIVRMLGDAGASVMTPDSRGFAPVTYLEEAESNRVRPDMLEAIRYCRDLDIVRMSQQATRLENKTTVFKSLRFKGSKSGPAADDNSSDAVSPASPFATSGTGPVDDKPSIFRGLRLKMSAAP